MTLQQMTDTVTQILLRVNTLKTNTEPELAWLLHQTLRYGAEIHFHTRTRATLYFPDFNQQPVGFPIEFYHSSSTWERVQ